ncbi:MAG: hypothetical protein E7550_02955 [Ruminococcaceae bacterium]|nr:hypothetical protein [Oscillospiraceae bacterium]
MAISVDTGKVDLAANNIRKYNSKIREDFSEVQSAINSLNSAWDGRACDNAMNAFNNLRDNYRDSRYAVVDNLVVFLKQQVAANYDHTESQIHTAAEAFK